MGSIAAAFASAFRDYVTEGVPASGLNDPVKSEVRAIGGTIESALGALSLGSVSVTKDTRAHLNADLVHAADTVALVYADTTDANNDLYVKVGGSGSGSWTLTNILHTAISGLAQTAVDTLVEPIADAAADSATLAGHYANDDTDTDVPGGTVGSRGAKFWADRAGDVAATLTYRASDLADALASTGNDQQSVLTQASGIADDTYVNDAGSLVFLAASPVGAGFLATQRIALSDAPLAVTPMPVAPLFSIYGIDGGFNGGRFVPSRGTSPSRNMLQRPDFSQSVNNSAIITPGFADPWGGNTAFRVQLPASNSYATLFTFSNTVSPTEAGDYRVGFTAKSNTGAGNQNFTLHEGLATPSVTTAVTEGAWATGELQLPGMANTSYVTVYNPSGTTPLDLIIAPLALSEQQVKLPAHPIPATGGVVNYRLSRAGCITIDNFGNIVGPLKGRINFTDDGIAHRSFAAMTMWLTFKKTGTSGAFSFNAPIWARTTGQPDLVLGTEADLFSIKGPGMTGFSADASWNAYGDEFLTLCIRFDATRTVASLGSIELAIGTGTGGTPFEIPWAYFMGGFGDTNVFPGLVHSWGVFEQYLEDDQLSRLVRHVNEDAQLFGNALGAQNVVFSAGDSITNGAGATSSNGFMQQAVAALNLKRINEAVAGTSFFDMTTDPRNANFKRKISQCVADGKRAIIHCLIGTNSPTQTAPQYQAQIDSWKALGTADNPVKVILGTIPDRTGRSNSVTVAYNTMVRGLVCDAIADYAADARIGGAGAAANTTYFNPDGIHPNDTGHGIMEPIGETAIAGQMR